MSGGTFIAIFALLGAYSLIHAAWAGRFSSPGRNARISRDRDPVLFWGFWGACAFVYALVIVMALDTVEAVIRQYAADISAWLAR